MFSRHTLTVALIASVAQAQRAPVNVQQKLQGGTDDNGDGVVDTRAASCQGTFSDDGTTQTWMVGVGSQEGMTNDTIIGWGKELCANGTIDWDSDYTIRLKVGDTTYETGQKLTCKKEATKEMQEQLQTQVDDKDAQKELQSVGKDIKNGDLTVMDSTASASADTTQAYTDTVDQIDSDATLQLETMETATHTQIDDLHTDATVTLDGDFDSKVQECVDRVTTTVTAEAEKLATDAKDQWDSSGTAELEKVTTAVTEEFGKMKEKRKQALDTERDETKQTVSDATTKLDESRSKDVEKIRKEGEKVENLDQDTVDGTITTTMDKEAEDWDKQLKEYEKQTDKSVKSFAAESKKALQQGSKDAKKAVKAAVDEVKKTVNTLLEDDKKGRKGVIKAIGKANKEVGTCTKEVIAATDAQIKEFGETMKEGIQQTITDESGKNKQNMSDARDSNLKPKMDTVTPLPQVSDDTFSLATLLDAGSTVTVEITRELDSVTSTCDLVEAEKPQDHCTQTAFDDVYFEYMDTMPKDGKTTDEAKERKPSKSHCGILNDADEDQCSTDLSALMDQLNAASKTTNDNMQDIWTLTQNIIKIEKKTGVSVYNNKQFLEWILNHESNLWDCQFILADTDGERISVDDTLNETGTCWITTDPTTWNAVTADVYDLFIGNVPAEEEDDTTETDDGTLEDWEDWEDLDAKEVKDHHDMEKDMEKKKKHKDSEQSHKIMTALDVGYAERVRYGLDAAPEAITATLQGTDTCDAERQEVAALMFADLSEMLVKNAHFEAAKEFAIRSEKWLRIAGQKKMTPEAIPEVTETTDDTTTDTTDDTTTTETTDDTTTTDDSTETTDDTTTTEEQVSSNKKNRRNRK